MRVIDPQDPPEAAPGFPVELPGGTVYRSDDLDVYRAGVNSVFYPARLDLVSPRTHLTHARLSAVQLSHLTLGIVHFGAEVLIDPGDVGGYHINIPLSGQWIPDAVHNRPSSPQDTPPSSPRTNTPSCPRGAPTPPRSASRSTAAHSKPNSPTSWGGPSIGE
ncbi:hypothetical protein FXW78_48625 [Rhodococcus opacus]|nr:hypothetical protein [Rhodococcus opacus]